MELFPSSQLFLPAAPLDRLFSFAMHAPWGWIAISSPVIIAYLLLKVTGIPATEEQAVRSKGDLYRQYQESTSVFIPWFKKQVSTLK